MDLFRNIRHVIFLFYIFQMLSALARSNISILKYRRITCLKSNTQNSEYTIENFLHKDKKLISISPGGFKGFYMMGVCKYIKQNYNLENFIFTGASAGAWNSLLLCSKRDIQEIQSNILDDSLYKTKSIYDLENLIKGKILKTYNTNDFELNKLFIGVTTIEHYKTNTTIFSGFDSLDDALNCCIASSHIPLVTGGFTNVYRNVFTFDGGFSKYPYLNTTRSVLHITPGIWKKTKPNPTMSITDYTTLFSKEQFNFNEMIEKGFEDTHNNKEYLDSIFI